MSHPKLSQVITDAIDAIRARSTVPAKQAFLPAPPQGGPPTPPQAGPPAAPQGGQPPAQGEPPPLSPEQLQAAAQEIASDPSGEAVQMLMSNPQQFAQSLGLSANDVAQLQQLLGQGGGAPPAAAQPAAPPQPPAQTAPPAASPAQAAPAQSAMPSNMLDEIRSTFMEMSGHIQQLQQQVRMESDKNARMEQEYQKLLTQVAQMTGEHKVMIQEFALIKRELARPQQVI